MRLYELSIPPTIYDAHRKLEKVGYECLGSGSYAEVFHKNGQPYVLKIFQNNDYGYIDFIKLVKSQHNEHFPKFYGNLVKVNDEYYAIRMEKLSECPLSFNTNIEFIWNYLDNNGDLQKCGIETNKFFDNNETFKEALDIIINNLLDRYEQDICLSNLMSRGNTIVIIDPVWGKPK